MAVPAHTPAKEKNTTKPKGKGVNEPIRSTIPKKLSLSDRLALGVADLFGSVKFLCFCVVFFICWILSNISLIPGVKPFDHYPFPALEMVVSIFAIILSVSVLISQNRLGRMEKVRQEVEFEVNVRAETEITKILEMLHAMQKKMGIHTNDKELDTMKEELNIQELHRKLDDMAD